MKKFNFVIPINGFIQTEIIAEDAQEAIDILMDKKAQFEYLPYGHVELEIENMIVTQSDEKVNLS